MSDLDPRLVRATSIGSQVCPTFCDYEDGRGTFEMKGEATYAPPAVDLRALRTTRGLTLRDVSKLLQLPAWQISGLERGELRPAKEDWAWISSPLSSLPLCACTPMQILELDFLSPTFATRTAWQAFLADVERGDTSVPESWRQPLLTCWRRLVELGGEDLPKPQVSSEDDNGRRDFLLLSWSTKDHYAEIEVDEHGERFWFGQIYPNDYAGDEGEVTSPWFFDLLKRA
jgi:hypothetical protein